MSKKQLTRFDVISKANEGFITNREASEVLGLSERQVKRLKKKVRDEGAGGVVHGNTGRQPTGKLSNEKKAKILEIRKKPEYAESNFCHFMDLLFGEYDICISYSTLYRLLTSEGINPPKSKRRRKKHRSRKRLPQAGLLLQTDASSHAWFIGDKKRYAIHGMIDDATGQITGLYMCKNECLHGYFEVLRMSIENFGVPLSLYADRHTIFQSPNTKASEINAGINVNDTQFSRCLKELSVNLIPANSPQAKGRVERLWGTLQSRLPIELSIRNITTIDGANEFLESYIYEHNINFAVDPENTKTAFRKLDADENINHILCIKETRSIDAGGVFSYRGNSFKIIDTDVPIPVKAKISVLIGSRIGIMAEYKGNVMQVLPFVPPKRVQQKKTDLKNPRIFASPPEEHLWKNGTVSYLYTFNELFMEQEENYQDTIRILESALLGRNR